jgi:hypothetical protein
VQEYLGPGNPPPVLIRPSYGLHLAYFEFVDEGDPRLQGTKGDENLRLRHQLMRKIPIDVAPLKQLGPGSYGVTFSLVTLTNAELTIQTKPKRP